jgi:hypothetical protein
VGSGDRPRYEHGRFLPKERVEEEAESAPPKGAAEHEQSDVDAMGLDKRREVVGQSYGPSTRRQLTMYGIFLAVLAALAIAGKLLVDELDKPPNEIEAEAVWKDNNIKPSPIDFRPSGDVETQTSGP